MATEIDKSDAKLSEIQKHIDSWFGYFADNNEKYKDNIKFSRGDQWDDDEVREYDRLGRPHFTFNKLYPYGKQLIGENSSMTPNLEVRDEVGNAEPSTVQMLGDLIRNISYTSSNDVIYQTAYSCALFGGYGAFFILSEFEGPNSFNQVARYRAIPNPLFSFFDPMATDPTKSNGDFSGVYQLMSREKFDSLYPDVESYESGPIGYSPFDNFNWFPGQDSVVVADFYEKQHFKKTIVLLTNGTDEIVVDLSELDETLRATRRVNKETQGKSGVFKEVKRRQASDYRVIHYKLFGHQILDAVEWPSKYLPVVFVDGDSMIVDGKQETTAFIEYAKDPQKYFNYLKSDIAYGIQTMRREQYVATPAMIAGHEEEWSTPHKQGAVLFANADPKTGQLPVKQPASEISQSELEQAVRTEADIQSTLGMFDANRGEGNPASSGIAEAHLIRQGNSTNFVYSRNLMRAIEQGGRIILDLIPRVYDTQRTVMVTTKDGKTEPTVINQKGEDGQVKNNITTGQFGIEVSAGPSFALQKKEAMALLMQLASLSPSFPPLLGDQIAVNMDVENAKQISERLQTLVPPQILAKEEGKPAPQAQPNPQAQLAQAQLQIEGEKAKASTTKAQADMLTAQVKAEEAKHKGISTAVKADAEIKKSQLGVLEAQVKMQNETEKQKLREENEHLKDSLAQVVNMLQQPQEF